MTREKILVIDQDINSLSKIYLALIHRKFKAEACDNPEEIFARLKRFKPSVLILHLKQYEEISKKLNIPSVVIFEKEGTITQLNYGDIPLRKPVSTEVLMKAVEDLI